MLCGSSTIPLIQNIGVEIQRAQNKHKFRTLFYAIMTSLNVVLTIVLCKTWGEIGAAVGTAISTIVVDVIAINVYYQRKLYIGILKFWLEILKMIRGIIIPIFVGLAIRLFVPIQTVSTLVAFILIYTAIYCVSMWIFVLNKEERDYLLWMIKKHKQ